MRKRRCEFLSRWLDVAVDGILIGEWCQELKGDTGKAVCSYCNIAIKYENIGVRTLKDHASSQKHKENRQAALSVARKKTAATLSQLPQPKEAKATDAITVIPPGPSVNCSVVLSPLTVDVLTPNLKKQTVDRSFPSCLQTWRKPGREEAKNPFIDVYICFYCGEEFPSRASLQNHQWTCDMKPPELQAVTPPGKAVMSRNEGPASPLPPLLCLHQEGTPEMHTPIKESLVYQYVRPSRESFISAIGLLPKRKAAQVCKRRRNTECESIDLDDDIPISPTIPRTPKLLISHLSRDGSESSGLNSSPLRRRRSLFSTQQSRVDTDGSDIVKEGDEVNEEEKHGEEKPKMHTKSLYSLDLTSPLGQFVIKHIKGDPSLHILSDVESHCLTSTPKKSAATSRLRERHVTHPVTFRGYMGKFFPSYMHQYNFTRQQKKEFMRRVNTGLDRKSRVLSRKMKPCKVKLTYLTKADLKRWMPAQNEITVDLKPLTADEITYWTSPKPVPAAASNTAAVFPSGLTFSSPNVNNVLGLRTRQDVAFFNRCRLSVSNYVSEETFAEVTANRRAVYKSLLSDSPSSESGSSEGENAPATVTSSPMSVLRQMLSKPSACTTPLRQVNTFPSDTNLKLDSLNNSLKYGVLSPVSNSSDCHMDKSSSEDGHKSCSFLSRVNRSISCSSSNTSVSSCVSKCSSLVITSEHDTVRLLGKSHADKPDSGPSSQRSGSYTVMVRSAAEGKKIRTVVMHHSPEKRSRTDGKCGIKGNSTVGKDKSVGNVGKGRASKRGSLATSTEDSTKKQPLRDTNGISTAKSKKRKLDNGSADKRSSVKPMLRKACVTPASGKTQQKLETGHQAPQDIRKVNSSVKAGITRAARAVKKAVRRLSRESASPKEQQKPHQINGNSTLRSSSRPNGTERRVVTADLKQTGVKVFAEQPRTVSPKENSRLNLRNSTASSGHEKLQVKTDGKQLQPLQFGKVVNGETSGAKAVRNASLTQKPRHVVQTDPGDSSENKDTENLGINAPLIGASSKNCEKMFPNAVLQTSACTSPNSKLSSQKDKSTTSGLKFVTHSSPHSPQLRSSSQRQTLSITQKAEVRKSLLSSFPLEASNKKHNVPFLATGLSPKLAGPVKVNSVKDKLRQTSSRGKDRR